MAKFIYFLKKFRMFRVAAGFMLAGIIIGGTGIYMCTVPEKERSVVSGTICEIIETYDGTEENYNYETYVDYTVNGTEYKHIPYGAYSTGMKKGDTVEILYAADDPEDIQAPGAENIKYIVAAAGVIAFIAGLVMLIKFLLTPAL